ncbi:MAG: hypothetical protein ABUL64_03060 [Singulisphaera sp.]
MIFDDNKARLLHAARTLRLRWEQTQAQWNDQVTRDFERRHLEHYEPKLATAVRALERLAELLTRVEHECK